MILKSPFMSPISSNDTFDKLMTRWHSHYMCHLSSPSSLRKALAEHATEWRPWKPFVAKPVSFLMPPSAICLAIVPVGRALLAPHAIRAILFCALVNEHAFRVVACTESVRHVCSRPRTLRCRQGNIQVPPLDGIWKRKCTCLPFSNASRMH